MGWLECEATASTRGLCATGDPSSVPVLVGASTPWQDASRDVSENPLAPPLEGKQLLGQRLDNHIDSTNFTVAWSDDDVAEDVAERTSVALEAAWQELVVERGFRIPVSADEYLIWVVLQPGLGAVGLTTEYTNAAYPEGYPVIFLDPVFGSSRDLWDSVVAHEAAHAIQFAYRAYDGSADQPFEPWFWEASAEWSSELVFPELDVYALSSRGYARDLSADHWSMQGEHAYGMFVVNAYLDEFIGGVDATRAVWEAGASASLALWPQVIEDVSGQPSEALFGRVALAYAYGMYADSHAYAIARIHGTVADGVGGRVGWLGARLYLAEESLDVSVRASDGRALLVTMEDSGASVRVDEGELVAVVGSSQEGAEFGLSVAPAVGGGGRTDSSENDRSTSSGVSSGFSEHQEAGCRVGGTFHAVGLGWGLTVMGLLTRRRSPSDSDATRCIGRSACSEGHSG